MFQAVCFKKYLGVLPSVLFLLFKGKVNHRQTLYLKGFDGGFTVAGTCGNRTPNGRSLEAKLTAVPLVSFWTGRKEDG